MLDSNLRTLHTDLRALIRQPQVTLIAKTQFLEAEAFLLTRWGTDRTGGEALAEFAGRACYQSWSKPNPATATNKGYLGHILEVGHTSVLEHATASFYLTGVSRAFTHEVIRHRHTEKSQLSQRYVDQADGVIGLGVVIPPAYRGRVSQELATLLSYRDALAYYETLVETDIEEGKLRRPDVRTSALRKQAREAARAVLPNCAETRMVLSGNLKAWRELIEQRATIHADAEMREVTVMIAKVLKAEFPNAFQDMQFGTDADSGVEIVEFFSFA